MTVTATKLLGLKYDHDCYGDHRLIKSIAELCHFSCHGLNLSSAVEKFVDLQKEWFVFSCIHHGK